MVATEMGVSVTTVANWSKITGAVWPLEYHPRVPKGRLPRSRENWSPNHPMADQILHCLFNYRDVAKVSEMVEMPNRNCIASVQKIYGIDMTLQDKTSLNRRAEAQANIKRRERIFRLYRMNRLGVPLPRMKKLIKGISTQEIAEMTRQTGQFITKRTEREDGFIDLKFMKHTKSLKERQAAHSLTEGHWGECWQDGLTLQQAVERTGYSKQAAMHWAHARGVKWPSYLNRELHEALLQLNADQASVLEARSILRVSKRDFETWARLNRIRWNERRVTIRTKTVYRHKFRKDGGLRRVSFKSDFIDAPEIARQNYLTLKTALVSGMTVGEASKRAKIPVPDLRWWAYRNKMVWREARDAEWSVLLNSRSGMTAYEAARVTGADPRELYFWAIRHHRSWLLNFDAEPYVAVSELDPAFAELTK